MEWVRAEVEGDGGLAQEVAEALVQDGARVLEPEMEAEEQAEMLLLRNKSTRSSAR